jgi:hypothetical protein
VSDRITLGVAAAHDLLAALREHEGYLAGETLATEVRDAVLEDPDYRQDAEVEGSPVTISLRRS